MGIRDALPSLNLTGSFQKWLPLDSGGAEGSVLKSRSGLR